MHLPPAFRPSCVQAAVASHGRGQRRQQPGGRAPVRGFELFRRSTLGGAASLLCGPRCCRWQRRGEEAVCPPRASEPAARRPHAAPQRYGVSLSAWAAAAWASPKRNRLLPPPSLWERLYWQVASRELSLF
ncbi:hypothetical protein GQ55_9G589000 [Panicum hallii var. hallii]|uniref:Uncharacterized protein n=1 Tax=Panicum hallii var. hallii TaxID=1504633 RepID=A0A2T7CGR4_9POAL|nr:hypothetical protein GQ55_9G589000 [Panicum hallii var. hallii]